MKSIVLLAVLALANSTPLGGLFNRFGPLQRNQWVRVSPAQQTSEEIRQQIQEARIANADQVTDETVQSALAQQAARGVIEQALLARQGQTVEGIEDLEKQLTERGRIDTWEQVPTLEAIQKLERRLRFQKGVAPQILVNSQLGQTLETIIQAQLAADDAEGGIQLKSFQARIQELIDICNIKEIEVEIVRQRATVDQLKEQLQLVEQQIQEIRNVPATYQLQRAQIVLRLQQQQLTNEILARRLVCVQLQEALLEQQRQLQQDTLSQKLEDQQGWSQRDIFSPQDTFSQRLQRQQGWTQRNIFSTPAVGGQRIVRGLPCCGGWWSQVRNPWSRYDEWTRAGRTLAQRDWSY